MKEFRYIDGVVSLELDRETCIGCGMCVEVCPQQVFEVAEGKAGLLDRDGCMECGACANNCPVAALKVKPGVGCAAYIIMKWWQQLTGRSGPISCC